MVECSTCHRVLKHEAALLQHCKDKGHPVVTQSAAKSPAQPVSATPASAPKSAANPSSSAAVASSSISTAFECRPCALHFADKDSYDLHNASQHPPKPFKCAPCSLEFSSAEALSIHLRHFAVHPKCPQCNSAFIDQTQLNLHQAIHPKCTQCGSAFVGRTELEVHVAAAHPPHFKCMPCGREFNMADRDKHYRESPNHPVCFVCGNGFVDDADIDKHLSSAHLDARCILCNRQFRTVDTLQNHYLTSYAHPHCALCNVGFPNDEACDKHMETNHPRPQPRIPSRAPRTPSPILRSDIAQTSSLGGQCTSQSQQSSPLVERRPLAPGVGILPTVEDESDMDDNMTYQTIEASSHVQRAISEPTVPTVSSIGYSVQEETTAWRSPTLSERSADYSNLHGFTKRRMQSESTLSLQSAPSLSRSSSRNGSSFIDNLQSPPIMNSAMQARESVLERAQSLISQNASPRSQSPTHSNRSFSISDRLSRGVTPIRPSLSRQPTPRILSPVLSPVRPMSRNGGMPVPIVMPKPNVVDVSGTSRSSSSCRSSLEKGASVVASPSLDTEETVPGQADTPKPKVSGLPPVKTTTVRWHCRICMRDPCAAPMATMCGHIFCTTCILQELVKNGSCPVCQKMFLLRLHVESH